jgi:hypothetical protein
MRRWLREPLLHFFITGALLFAAYGLIGDEEDDGAGSGGVIRITSAEVDWLTQTWARQWGRPPSVEEARGIITGYLEEELLAREARALSLDEDDTVVRRRLAQKMEFMVRDTWMAGEPGDEELRRLYASHSERFRARARVDFTHVYFSREQRGPHAEADARAALQQLSGAAGADPVQLGDRFLGPYDFSAADQQAVAAALGDEFARRVLAMTPGDWRGPIGSAYGLHLVRVTGAEPARQPQFQSVRNDVLALWRELREQEERAQYFAALLDKYEVVVDESIEPLVGPLSPARAASQ